MRWVLNLDNGFVRGGESTAVDKVVYRKVGELLVVLAESGRKGASRQQLVERLWPSAGYAARATNLRQALHHLRRIVGGDLVASSTVCRLGSDAEVFIESDDGSSRKVSGAAEASVTPVDAFAALIEWLSLSDPNRFLQLIATCPDMGQCLPSSLMQKAIDHAAPGIDSNHPNLPWLTYWRTNTELSASGIRRAHPSLQRTARLVYRQTDPVLVREATYDIAASEILLGCPDVALQRIDEAEAFIGNSSAAKSHRMGDLRGSALMHLGRHVEALELMNRAVEETAAAGSIDFAWHEGLRALYTANTGDFDLAARLNEAPARLGRELGARNVLAVSALTSAIVEASFDPWRAARALTELIGYCRTHQITNIALYAQETLADVFAAAKSFEDARRTFDSTKAMRHGLGYSYTQWDRRRLRRIAPATS